MKIIRKTLLATLFIGLFPLHALAATSSGAATPEQQTARELVASLERLHQPLDASLGSRLIDNYLNALDRHRDFFLQSDIAEFERYRATVVDELRRGDTTAGSAIFQRFRQRAGDRYRKSIEALPASIAAMKFDGDDYFEPTLPANRPWPADLAASDAAWQSYLKNAALELRLDGRSNPEIVRALNARLGGMLRRLDEQGEGDMLSYFLNALVALYQDPSATAYLLPPKKLDMSNFKRPAGLGLILKSRASYIEVGGTTPGGPADRHGVLKRGDRIVAIGQGAGGEMQDVIGWRVEDAAELMRGDPGGVVRLEVIPVAAGPAGRRETLEIVRDYVTLREQSVAYRVVEIPRGDKVHRIGVIDVPSLYRDIEAMRKGDANYRSATHGVRDVLAKLAEAGADGVILNLRGNGGGALEEAGPLVRLFIDEGPMLQVRSLAGSGRVEVLGGKKSDPAYQGPLVVLVDGSTAAGAEIVAGTLQDYQRALVIGSKTAGAGAVQQYHELSHGMVRLDQGGLYRVSGAGIQGQGVTPDIVFPALYENAAAPTGTAVDRIAAQPHKTYFAIAAALPALQTAHQRRSGADSTFQAIAAQRAKLAAQPTRVSLNEALRQKQRENSTAERPADSAITEAFVREAAQILIDGMPLF